MPQMSKHDVAKTVAEATPAAIAATAGPLFGIQWDKWAAMLGCLFLLLQMGYLAWKWWRDYKRERRGLPPRESGFASTGSDGNG